MIRIRGALVVLEMAGGAGGAQGSVLSARMTLGARRGGMRAGQREPSRIVIERGAGPIRCRVAELAVLRKTGCDVIGAGGGLKVLQVAGHAIRADVGIVAARMALQASDGVMRSGKRECREVMIERSS